MSVRTPSMQVLVAGLIASVAAPQAFSQAAGAGEEATPRRSLLEEIVVSARKRDESALEVPLSLQAFSETQLNAAGLKDLEGLAAFTPNLDFQNLGNIQPGRYNSVIRFRGMNTAITTPTNQTGGFFVDGVNVLGGASSIAMSDIERIEVIRGPQPVYFGRGTFGGAINYTTITPGQDFSGNVSVGYSPTYGSSDMTFYVEGGLTDTLAARLTYSTRKVGGAFTATDGGELGEESTDALSVILAFDPTDRLSVKARIAYSEDDDGAPAGTYVPFRLHGNVAPGTPITVNTDRGKVTTALTKPYHKGNVPSVRVSNNTGYYVMSNGVDTGEFFRNYEMEGDTPYLAGIGLRTDLLTGSLAFDYQLTDTLTLSGLFGHNERQTTQMRDADQYDNKTWLIKTWLELESQSSELRLTWDDGGPLRLLGGVSYSEMAQRGDVDGGMNAFDGYFGSVLTGFGPSLLDITDIETWGVFASAEYDINDWMTVAFEGRYQDEEIKNRSGVTMDALTPAVATDYDVFLPRVNLTVRPTMNSSVYLSYAKGTLPGSYNSMFDTMTPQDRDKFLSENPKVSQQIAEEELEAYELGWKQSVFDGDGWFSAVLFHQDWTAMKTTGFIAFTNSAGNAMFLTPTIPGASTQTGLELEGQWQITPNLMVHAAHGYVKSEYKETFVSNINAIVGLGRDTNFNAEGNTLPRSPKHSGFVSATWTDTLNADWDYFIRGDITYRSKTYIDELNLTTIEGYHTINLRVGLEGENGTRLELFCTNCADESGWATGRRAIDFGEMPNYFGNDGAVVNPIRPREFGIRASYMF